MIIRRARERDVIKVSPNGLAGGDDGRVVVTTGATRRA